LRGAAIARCQAVARKATMKGYVLGRAMETAEPGVMPNLASFNWKEEISAVSCSYEMVIGCFPGTMMAVSWDECEKAFVRVVMVNIPIG
jgi:hypothetical protein